MSKTKRSGLCLLMFALALAGCATPPAKAPPKVEFRPASPEEMKQIERIEAVGREIYRLDQLAWHATDALQAKAPPIAPGSSGGWVITNTREGPVVTFVESNGGALSVFADVMMRDGVPPDVHIRPERALSALEAAMFHARTTALGAAQNICGGARNTVVLPAETGGWDVYVLAASSQANILPLGGHARVHVSTDGMTALDVEPYSKSCLDMDISAPNLVDVMATHIVSDLPAPTHVFLSLTYPKPIVLATRNHLWKIDAGRITTID